MSERRYVLDTSALLAWIEGEEGAARVRALLVGNDEVLLPWPVLMETYYITSRERGEDAAMLRHATIKELPVTFLEQMDEPLLFGAARLKAQHPISMVDALIAAYATAAQAVLVHKDPEYEMLCDKLALEPLPYKTGQSHGLTDRENS